MLHHHNSNWITKLCTLICILKEGDLQKISANKVLQQKVTWIKLESNTME
jgi:hypothetical protein